MSEQIVLDPSETAGANRTPLDITPWIRQEGTDWGDSVISPFMADRDRGSIPVDFTVPNRPVNIPLRFSQALGGTSVAQARANIQAKVALFQKEGGWIKRILNTGGTYYADVVDAGALGFSSIAGFESAQNVDIDPSVALTLLPDFYQDEITLADHTETTNAELVFTETGIKGDYPARVRIVVDDDQGQDQRGLIWGFRSRHYDSASTAALRYEAESLGPLDTAAKAALSGASGGTVVTHGTLSTNWTPALSTNVGGTQFLTHTGTYRLWARIYSTSGTTTQARAVWDVGDLVNPAENDAWRLPGASNFYDHDFGEVRLDASPVGTHRWQGQIQAKGDAGGENFSVDKIWFEPVDEGSGVLTAPISTAPGAANYSARSEFNTESGAITGDALQTGGNWTVVTNSDTDDFSAAGGVATRTAVDDSGTGADPVMKGRGVTAGATNYTNIVTSWDFKWSAYRPSLNSGVLARVTDSSNYLVAYVQQALGASLGAVVVAKVVAGSSTFLTFPAGTQINLNAFYTLRLGVFSSGNWSVSLFMQGSSTPQFSASGSDSALATGGTLATGKIGIVDYAPTTAGGSGVTRTYDNFAAWVPSADAVTFASRSTQLTTDGHYRLDSGGTAYGPVPVPSGDLPRLPVAGLEGRTTEVFIKSSRGDFDQLPDSGIDDLSARVYYRPCYLNVGTA